MIPGTCLGTLISYEGKRTAYQAALCVSVTTANAWKVRWSAQVCPVRDERHSDMVLRMLLAPLHRYYSATSSRRHCWHIPSPCSDQKPPPGTLPGPYWLHSSVARQSSSWPGSPLFQRVEELSGFLRRSGSSWCFCFTSEEHRLLLSNSSEPASSEGVGPTEELLVFKETGILPCHLVGAAVLSSENLSFHVPADATNLPKQYLSFWVRAADTKMPI